MIRQELGGTRDRCRMSPVQLPSYCLSAPDPPFQALLCDAGAGILETICGFASSPLLVSAKWGGCPGRSCKPGRGKGTALPVSFRVIPESITPASHVHLGHTCFFLSLPGAYQVPLVVKKKKKKSAHLFRRLKRRGFNPWVGKIPWRRKWQPTPVFLPGKSHGQRSLASYSHWGPKDSD